MTTAKVGDTVKVHYTGKLEDGKVFDTSKTRDPVEFQIGQGQLIPGFEEAVVGMKPGDVRETRVPKEKAYGTWREENRVPVNRKHFPENVDEMVGKRVHLQTSSGKSQNVRIEEVGKNQVVLDTNHPLAGHDLTFEIELEAIV